MITKPGTKPEHHNAAVYYADKTQPSALLDDATPGERDRWQTAYDSELWRLQNPDRVSLFSKAIVCSGEPDLQESAPLPETEVK